jgi:hypothetical protein
MARFRLALWWAFFCLPLCAKNMDGRLGLGLTIHDYDHTPALSMRYHLSNYTSSTILVGFNSESAIQSFVFGGKLQQNAHLEENLNFYVGVGLFVVQDKGPDPSPSTGIEVDGLFGTEFFFSGLPNLGIQVETGVAMTTLRNVSFRTVGNGFFGGAIHYYL